MDKRLERILPRVQKPARYVGGEFNAIMKDKSKVDTRVAFCFPLGPELLGFGQPGGLWQTAGDRGFEHRWIPLA